MDIETAWKIIFANACCTMGNNCNSCPFNDVESNCILDQQIDTLLPVAVETILKYGGGMKWEKF